jgi:hypothetical protein
MYALMQEQWYALTSRISLQTNFYMTQEDEVFVVDVVVTDLRQKTMASSVIN